MNLSTSEPDSIPEKAQTAAAEFIDLTEQELDQLIERIEQARDHELALSREDYVLLLSALLTLANVQERLNNNDLTIRKLKKLLGIIRSSERLKDLLPTETDEGGDSSSDQQSASSGSDSKDINNQKKRRKRKPRPGRTKKPTTHQHSLAGICKGDTCPECQAGRLYKYTPATLLRVVGHAPLSSERHLCEQLRCSGCGEIYTADLPEHVKGDGRAGQKYGYSARSVMAIYKYFAGNPFYRQQSVNTLLGEPVSASTIFDQCEQVANALNPVFKAIRELAANASLFYLDDTSNRILNQKPVNKTRNGQERLRSGIYTSACLAVTEEAHQLVLFQTNIGHAGEWMEEILRRRDASRGPPIIMSDALSSNKISGTPYIKALCNSHGRRGFHELVEQHPDEVLHALELYRHVWKHERHCVNQSFSSEQRLAYHTQHSLPCMASILAWCNESLETQAVEANSNLGKAMAYFIRHYEGLTAFCRVAGAPIDNNRIERLIKVIVRARKNSLFFKTAVGADISDISTSILATCYEADVDAFSYLNAVQGNQLAVKTSPQKWLPWNYPQDK